VERSLEGLLLDPQLASLQQETDAMRGGADGVRSALEAELAMLERDLHSQAGSSAAQPDLPLPPAAPAIVAPPVRSPLNTRGVA
jgi:hypothetical protein